nr:ATP-binding protein [Streptomyces sp. SID13588]
MGLSAFTEDDAEFFYGRDRDTGRVLEAVCTRPVTIVVGPSGCGKSSLVQAGVLPRLRAKGVSISEVRPTSGLSAAAVLARALAEVLEQGLGETERPARTLELLELLKIDRIDSVAAELRAEVLVYGGIAGHVLFVDQLEEYADAEPQAARDLFGLLAALAGKDGSATLHIVTTARPGSLDTLVTVDTSRLVSEAVCFLAPLARADLARAVSGPVDAMPGLSFEPGLPDRILEAARDEPGRMPLIQVTLTELWMQRTRSSLTHAAYDDIGGVAGSIASYAEHALNLLTQAQRDCVPRLFVQLVRPGDGDAYSRQPVRATDLSPELLDLARELATRRLVVLHHAPGGADGEEIVDLPHEALIQLWPRLRQWLVDYRDFRVWQEQLRADLRRWQTHAQETARLLRGYDLAEALDRLAKHPEDISADERGYILLSHRRSRWRAGRAVQTASGVAGKAAVSTKQVKDSGSRPHWQGLTVVGLWVAVLLAAASISVHGLLSSFRLHSQLGPSDTPAVVTAIVALGTATGTLIGVVLTSYAKYVQARGQAEADLIRARAEMMRAEADVTRARAGLPPHTPSVNGDPSAPTPLASLAAPDASQPPPSVGSPDAP